MSSIERVSRLVRDPAAGAHAVARRGRKLADKVRGRVPVPDDGFPADDPSRCMICGTMKTRLREFTWGPRTYQVRVCQVCRYVSNFDNTVDYTKFQSPDEFELTPRVGTDDHPGREFHMAKMGAGILKRELSVMVFGAGSSLDYQHIAKLPSVNKVIMSDIVDVRGEADFINITDGTDQRFDLIIACEVVEHFIDPRNEFPRLFDLLTPDGLLVCSTNIYDSGNPNLDSYLYLPGHTSYYSPRSIGVIAKQNNMHFDFRMPKYGPPQVFGKRKRYILFSHSLENLRKTAEYFGSHAFAPAEEPRPQTAANGNDVGATAATEPSATPDRAPDHNAL